MAQVVQKKTTALLTALSILGAQKNNLYSRGTKGSVVSILSNHMISICLDDPQPIKNINKLLIDLFGGAKIQALRGSKQAAWNGFDKGKNVFAYSFLWSFS